MAVDEQVDAPAREGREKEAHALDVEDGVRPRDLVGQDGARLARGALELRDEHHEAERGRHGQAHRRHGGAIGARHGQPTEDGRGDIVRVSLGAGREGHEPLAVDGIAEERIGPGEPAHPCRRARPEAPTQRDPVHTVNGGPAERTARDLEGHPRAAGDDIVAAGVESARSLAFDRDDERVRRTPRW